MTLNSSNWLWCVFGTCSYRRNDNDDDVDKSEKSYLLFNIIFYTWNDTFTTIHKTLRHDIDRMLNNLFNKCLAFLCTMCVYMELKQKSNYLKLATIKQQLLRYILYALLGSLFVWNTCALSLEDINICPYLNKYQSIKLMNYPQQKMSWFLVAWVVAYNIFIFLLFFACFLLQIFFQRLSPNWLIVQLCYETIFSGFLLFKQKKKTINIIFPHSRSEPCAGCFWCA